MLNCGVRPPTLVMPEPKCVLTRFTGFGITDPIP